MERSNLFMAFFFLLISISISIGCISAAHHHSAASSKPTKLFVFGDSYADTGNVMKSLASSWKEPYGVTFPGKPAGRFSDGRVLTDYFARFLGLKSPVAYRWMNYVGKKVRYGMNFAYGGSGVFTTLGDLLPNMTTQIDFFQKLMNQSVYTKQDLQSSVVLICLAGNDYAFYLATGGTAQGLQNLIPQVINQLGVNINRIRELGATKIVVTSLEPIGCLPRLTQPSSFQHCNATQNVAVEYHNLLLGQAVANLNNQTGKSTIFLLDLYNSFISVLNQKGDYQGLKFESPLKPCCMGISSEYFCGSVDDKGAKMYTVCSDPKYAFFWDSSHPTEAGWNAVYMTLKSSLEHHFNLN